MDFPARGQQPRRKAHVAVTGLGPRCMWFFWFYEMGISVVCVASSEMPRLSLGLSLLDLELAVNAGHGVVYCCIILFFRFQNPGIILCGKRHLD